MTIKTVSDLDGDLAHTAWNLYRDAMSTVNDLAAQRHLMTRTEFDQVAADTRIDKLLALDDAGQLAGLATLTNQLDAVDLIADEFFRRHWPDAHREHRIWYIGLVAVHPQQQGRGAFGDLFTHIYDVAAPHDGLVGLDICRFNEDIRHLPHAIQLLLRRMSGGRAVTERVDTQSFWLHDLTGATLGGPR